jgi:hypothetical protein
MYYRKVRTTLAKKRVDYLKVIMMGLCQRLYLCLQAIETPSLNRGDKKNFKVLTYKDVG